MDIDALKAKGFDTDKALELIGGSKEIYQKIINTYYNTISSKIEAIKDAKAKNDINEYVILVHALKSSSRQIGASELGENAYHLELSGKAGNVAEIERLTDKLLQEYEAVGNMLEEFVTEKVGISAVEKKEISSALAKAKALKLKQCAKKFDIDGINAVTDELKKYNFNSEQSEILKKIEDASISFKYDIVEKNAEQLMKLI